MTREELEARYPRMLASCYDFSPPDGWLPLVAELFERLDRLCVNVCQVKSKFGELRVYGDGPLDDNGAARRAYALVDEYERRSRTICEVCGEPGSQVVNNSWVSVKCEAHR